MIAVQTYGHLPDGIIFRNGQSLRNGTCGLVQVGQKTEQQKAQVTQEPMSRGENLPSMGDTMLAKQWRHIKLVDEVGHHRVSPLHPSAGPWLAIPPSYSRRLIVVPRDGA